MKKNKEQPELKFNSRIRRLFIELPDFEYSLSESPHSPLFIGREKILRRLKEFIINNASGKGVYMVAGNRGVGKTSLVEKLKKETSLSNSVSPSMHFIFALICVFYVLPLPLYC